MVAQPSCVQKQKSISNLVVDVNKYLTTLGTRVWFSDLPCYRSMLQYIKLTLPLFHLHFIKHDRSFKLNICLKIRFIKIYAFGWSWAIFLLKTILIFHTIKFNRHF